jgi:hypothetical protein
MLTKPVRDEYIIAGDFTFHSMKWVRFPHIESRLRVY